MASASVLGGDTLPTAAGPSSSTIAPTASPSSPSSQSSANNAERRQLSGWKHSAAGSLGGMTGAIVTSPFDVVKTRLQSDLFRHRATPSAAAAAANLTEKSRGGLWQFVDTLKLIRQIGTQEGWRALYKGLGPSLVGIIPARAINFYCYPTSKAYFAAKFPNAVTEAGQKAEDSPLIHLGAAVVAGMCTATGTNPIWVVKTRLQLSARKTQPAQPAAAPSPAASPLPKPIAQSAAALAGSTPITAPAVAARKSIFGPAVTMTLDIIRNEGIAGLYRGLSASYLGVSEGVIQWVLYERFKKLSRVSSAQEKEQSSLLSYIGGIVGASGGAKAVASLITYPHEVIRTRLRQPAVHGVIKYTGLVQTLKLIVKEEGVASLYGGLTAHMLRVVPNAACMFLIYELVAAKLA